MKNPVLATTLKVVKKAKDVKINQGEVKKVAEKWTRSEVLTPVWPSSFHLQTRNRRAMLDYLILLDTLNFCFWSRKKKWRIEYKGKKYNGYFALALSLKRFFEANPKKANLDCFSRISQKEFFLILDGEGELLFLKERWRIARAVSLALIKKYRSAENFISSARQKFSILLFKILKDLPFFDDIAYYGKQRVYFLKRAQILCTDIWGAFKGRGIGYFKDLDYLTAFADYKLPQILRRLGILEYSSSLERKIKNKTIIPYGSEQEIEIRSSTIWAVEYLKKALAEAGKKIYSFEIDWLLWNKSQKIKTRIPHHLTKTIFY